MRRKAEEVLERQLSGGGDTEVISNDGKKDGGCKKESGEEKAGGV